MMISVARSSMTTPSELADINGRPRTRRQQQCPERIAIAFTFERAPERQRAGKGNGDPENAGCRLSNRPAVTAFADERH